jgi:hypothetical protein
MTHTMYKILSIISRVKYLQYVNLLYYYEQQKKALVRISIDR